MLFNLKVTPASLFNAIKTEINDALKKKSLTIPSMLVIRDNGLVLITKLNSLVKGSASDQKLLLQNAGELSKLLDHFTVLQKTPEKANDVMFMEKLFASLEKYNASFIQFERLVEDKDNKKGYEPPKLI